MTPTADLLTTQQLAAALHVSPPTVVNWQRAGKIPAQIAEGRVLRFDLELVRAHLAKRARANKAMTYSHKP